MIWTHKEKPQPEWEWWFAWKPVPIGRYPIQDGQTIVWLQWVLRKFIDYRGSAAYEYKLPGTTPQYRKKCKECGYVNVGTEIKSTPRKKPNFFFKATPISKATHIPDEDERVCPMCNSFRYYWEISNESES